MRACGDVADVFCHADRDDGRTDVHGRVVSEMLV